MEGVGSVSVSVSVSGSKQLSPTRLATKKDPLRLAIAAARRVATTDKRKFNEDEFVRIWMEMEQRESDDLMEEEQVSVDSVANIPCYIFEYDPVRQIDATIHKREYDLRLLQRVSTVKKKGLERDSIALDKMRLALVAAKTAVAVATRMAV